MKKFSRKMLISCSYFNGESSSTSKKPSKSYRLNPYNKFNKIFSPANPDWFSLTINSLKNPPKTHHLIHSVPVISLRQFRDAIHASLCPKVESHVQIPPQ